MNDLEAGYRAVETLYHAFLTGLILTTVSRRSGPDAAELVFRTFRRQHLEKFLPGLANLGLTGLPDAVARAQYHYLSNHRGACASSTCTSRIARPGSGTCRPAGSTRGRR